MAPQLPSLRFVLLRPRFSENLGAVARALKNFGFSDWGTVDSQVAEFAGAQRMAVQAEDVLRARQGFPSLAEAVADCTWVVGTSSRKVPGKRRLLPREVATELLRQDRVALVFGDERSGLSNEEIAQCHALSALPTEGEQPSVNLAQALLLYAYECRSALTSAENRPPGPLAQAATSAEVEQLTATFKSVLERGGFLKDEGRPALAQLCAPWVRSRLSRAEARLWMAALQSLGKSLP